MRNHFRLPFAILFTVVMFSFVVGIKPMLADTIYEPVPYEDIGSILEQHEEESDRVSVEVIGQSVQGRDIYAVTIIDGDQGEAIEESEELRDLMIEDPEEAQEFVEENPDVKVPFMINGSVHGNEYVGTDAVLKLIDRFAYDNDETTEQILEENILVFNVVANPDGRILGTRQNSNGYDLNRDFVTIAQPETDVNIDLIVDWLPLVHLDLHGYVVRSADAPGLIEPTTAPHNPNIEHDLYIKWALDQAEAMEDELVSNKDDFETDMYRNMTGTHIPYRDAEDGWDDYPPIFTPGYTMYHGTYVATLEAPTNSVDGVDWHYHAVMGALKFATENKAGMLLDQIEVFKRGMENDHPNYEDGFFPEAYLLPVNDRDPSVTVKTVNHLRKSGIKVLEAQNAFTADGKQYEEGTFIVNMRQARAGLANTLLWDGEDISDQVTAMYDISGWSLPELWGFDAIPAYSSVEVEASEVESVELEGNLAGEGPYEISNSSVESVALVNKLIDNGFQVYKAQNGNFYVDAEDRELLSDLVQETLGITLETKAIPNESSLLDEVNVALLNDSGMHGTRTALQRLGFQPDDIETEDIVEHGLGEYDVLIANGRSIHDSDVYKQHIEEFIENGGKYIAIGAQASNAAVELGLADVNVNSGSRNSNGIVTVEYKDTSLTGGYASHDFGFVYQPVWYTNLEDDRVVASYSEQNFFRAGFWRNSQVAQGQPVIIKGHDPGVTLLGLEAGFRGHPENLFRLLSNAIYPGEETILTTIDGMQERAERYEEEGEVNEQVIRSLQMHLEAVSQFANQGKGDKVVRHMGGFDQLLDAYYNDELISDKAYKILKTDTQSIITKWQQL
ncbi:M14 family zinc carboxypeptidase [Virgibacillus sp. YIM 98842]|uniref:FIMAH domain-containing protein n=1 Tax=Virgibacillus sp. YIM 98842 TaxID=2663533 RepID=UPI0013DB28B2|nr:M14 family zinc carboxypeptidase [Virgibacillus sp. YIM 98842]